MNNLTQVENHEYSNFLSPHSNPPYTNKESYNSPSHSKVLDSDSSSSRKRRKHKSDSKDSKKKKRKSLQYNLDSQATLISPSSSIVTNDTSPFEAQKIIDSSSNIGDSEVSPRDSNLLDFSLSYGSQDSNQSNHIKDSSIIKSKKSSSHKSDRKKAKIKKSKSSFLPSDIFNFNSTDLDPETSLSNSVPGSKNADSFSTISSINNGTVSSKKKDDHYSLIRKKSKHSEKKRSKKHKNIINGNTIDSLYFLDTSGDIPQNNVSNSDFYAEKTPFNPETPTPIRLETPKRFPSSNIQNPNSSSLFSSPNPPPESFSQYKKYTPASLPGTKYSIDKAINGIKKLTNEIESFSPNQKNPPSLPAKPGFKFSFVPPPDSDIPPTINYSSTKRKHYDVFFQRFLTKKDRESVLENIENLDYFGGNLPFKIYKNIPSWESIPDYNHDDLPNPIDENTYHSNQFRIFRQCLAYIPKKRGDTVLFPPGADEFNDLLEYHLKDRFGSLIPRKRKPTSNESPFGIANDLDSGLPLNALYLYDEVSKDVRNDLLSFLKEFSNLKKIVPKELRKYLKIRVSYEYNNLHYGIWTHWEYIILVIAFNAVLHATTLRRRTLTEFMFFRGTTNGNSVYVLPVVTTLIQEFFPHRSRSSLLSKLKTFFYPRSRFGPYDESDDYSLTQGIKHGLNNSKVSLLIGRTASQAYGRAQFLSDIGKNTGPWSLEERISLKEALDKHCPHPVEGKRSRIPFVNLHYDIETRSKRDIIKFYYSQVAPNLPNWDPEIEYPPLKVRFDKRFSEENFGWNKQNFLIVCDYFYKQSIDYLHNVDWDFFKYSLGKYFGGNLYRKFKACIMSVPDNRSLRFTDVLHNAQMIAEF
ncbi:hypothetical protein AYI68_g5753 [Smittium mucronatum]|uniref:Uncharacterized protein n=1 Tax=Smittium mucronatum TaxID=133383 RepID=A0A1R0GTD8_9FUNG|nr:hypothetical protein AYI68_g5753 [Smittium mucronatum]